MNVEMELSRILIQENSDHQLIYLQEKNGDRGFPIAIGINEAIAIDRRLKGIPTPRPLTHELLHRVIEQLGGNLTQVIINDLREDVFYATLLIAQNNQTIEVDSRPSDAIALGIVNLTPIFVAEHVLDAVGS